MEAVSDSQRPALEQAVVQLDQLREHLGTSEALFIEDDGLALADLGLVALRRLASFFDVAAMDLQNDPARRRFFSEALILTRAAVRCCFQAELL